MPIYNENNAQLVKKSNELINAAHRMTRNHFLLFALAISKLRDDTNPPSKQVEVYKNEIFSLFESKSSDKYARIKKEVRTLQKEAWVSMKINESGDEFWGFVIPKVIWHNQKDYVTFVFDEDLIPHLLNLKERFTTYSLDIVSQFKSTYSLRIYELIQSHYFSTKEEHLNKWIFEVEDLKRKLDCVDTFRDFYDFEKVVLKVAQKEINETKNSDLYIMYTKIKHGKKVTHVEFKFKNPNRTVPKNQISIDDVNASNEVFKYNWLENKKITGK